jgi:hypothetical protein
MLRNESRFGLIKHFLLSLMLLLVGTISRSERCVAQAVATPKWRPTNVRLLSVNSPTKDEDPSVICGRDGTVFVAWFSDRGGNPDIYLTATTDGTTWKAPIRVTTSPEGDFYPNLFQNYQGIFHLVWFRWSALFRGHILHNSSLDGLTWRQEGEELVTTETDVDDWVPTITQAPDSTLLVFFVSGRRHPTNPTSDIYLATKRLGETGWSQAVAPAGLNSATEHDQLPFATQTGDKLTLVWVRHDTTSVLPWTSPKSDLFFSTSTDGQHWTAAAKITNETGNVVNLFPAIYAKPDLDWTLIWLSNKPGHPVVFELPLANANIYPEGRIRNKRFGVGYSHRIAPTPTPGIYIGVWVEGPEGSQDIFYRLFKRS